MQRQYVHVHARTISYFDSAPGDGAARVQLQADGKIVVAGTQQNGLTGQDFTVYRLNVDGTPDESFGNAGRFSF